MQSKSAKNSSFKIKFKVSLGQRGQYYHLLQICTQNNGILYWLNETMVSMKQTWSKYLNQSKEIK